MNLRDKLRAVGGSSGKGQNRGAESGSRDCRHLAVYRPMTEFPGALEVQRETVARMSTAPLPESFDPRRILYLDTETTGLGGSGTVAFLVGLGYLTDAGFIQASYDDGRETVQTVKTDIVFEDEKYYSVAQTAPV